MNSPQSQRALFFFKGIKIKKLKKIGELFFHFYESGAPALCSSQPSASTFVFIKNKCILSKAQLEFEIIQLIE